MQAAAHRSSPPPFLFSLSLHYPFFSPFITFSSRYKSPHFSSPPFLAFSPLCSSSPLFTPLYHLLTFFLLLTFLPCLFILFSSFLSLHFSDLIFSFLWSHRALPLSSWFPSLFPPLISFPSFFFIAFHFLAFLLFIPVLLSFFFRHCPLLLSFLLLHLSFSFVVSFSYSSCLSLLTLFSFSPSSSSFISTPLPPSALLFTFFFSSFLHSCFFPPH